MIVTRLEVELELQVPAYTTATRIWDPSRTVTYTTAQGDQHWEIASESTKPRKHKTVQNDRLQAGQILESGES